MRIDIVLTTNNKFYFFNHKMREEIRKKEGFKSYESRIFNFETKDILKHFEIKKENIVWCFGAVLDHYSDEKAIAILRTCHESMHKNSKLCVIEGIKSANNDNKVMALRDLTMLVTMPSGKERSLEELNTLASAAGLVMENHISISVTSNLIIYSKKV